MASHTKHNLCFVWFFYVKQDGWSIFYEPRTRLSSQDCERVIDILVGRKSNGLKNLRHIRS